MPKHSHGQNLPENLDLKSPALKLAAIETQAEDLSIALRMTGNAAEKSAGDLALVIGRHRKAVGGEV